MELPSKIPLDSITSSTEVISPFTCPAALISTRSACILPSTKPCTTKRFVVISPFTCPFLPTFTSLEDLINPSNSPSIYKLHESSTSPLILAPAVIIVVFESVLSPLAVMLPLLKIAMVLFSPF